MTVEDLPTRQPSNQKKFTSLRMNSNLRAKHWIGNSEVADLMAVLSVATYQACFKLLTTCSKHVTTTRNKCVLTQLVDCHVKTCTQGFHNVREFLYTRQSLNITLTQKSSGRC